MESMRVIGHGIDVVEVRRIETMLADHGPQFVARCFTEEERDYADSGSRRRAERYAVRFAGKEAVFKALGTGWRSGISWQDVEFKRDPLGKPIVKLRGRCAELASELGIVQWHVSLSHSESIALASVIGSG